MDKLIEDGRREIDPQKRKTIYEQAQEIELKEAPVVPIRTIDHIAVSSKNVKGFWLNPIGYLMLDNVTVQ